MASPCNSEHQPGHKLPPTDVIGGRWVGYLRQLPDLVSAESGARADQERIEGEAKEKIDKLTERVRTLNQQIMSNS